MNFISLGNYFDFYIFASLIGGLTVRKEMQQGTMTLTELIKLNKKKLYNVYVMLRAGEI